MKKNKLYKKERFAGCLLGASLGDALGYEVKNLGFSQIKKAYGKKGITKLKPEKGQKTVKVSDETQLMLFTSHGILWADAEAVRSEDTDYTRYVFYAYQQWLYTQTGATSCANMEWVLDDNQTGYPCKYLDMPELSKKRSPTKQIVAALSSIKDSKYGTLIKSINNNRLFDAVPRVIPAGLYFYSDPERAFRVGAEFAAITHSHPSAYLSAGCLATIISYICKGHTIEKATLGAMKILKDYDGFEDVFAALNKAIDLAEGDGKPMNDVKELGAGSNAESALAIGIYCACAHYDFKYAVQLAANQDGNSDACACIAGALKGCYLGFNQLPHKWLKKLQLADIVKECASELTKTAPKNFVA